MKILVCYEENPEGCKWFIIKDPQVDVLVALDCLHGMFQNNDEFNETQQAAASLFSEWFTGWKDGEDEKQTPRFVPVTDLKDLLKEGPFDRVYHFTLS